MGKIVVEILASCSYQDSLKFDGKLVIEGDEDSKSDKVSLNVVVDDPDTLITNVKPCVKCITFTNGVDPKKVEGVDIFNEVPLQQYLDGVLSFDDWSITLVRLPDNYSDMRTVKSICSSDGVRVVGGNLLNIDGVKIGRYDNGKEKGSPVYNGIYDQFLEIPLSDIGNLKDVVKKARKRLDSSKEGTSTKTPKEKKLGTKKADIAKSFSSLFSGNEEEEF